jgi:hypothetical protein
MVATATEPYLGRLYGASSAGPAARAADYHCWPFLSQWSQCSAYVCRQNRCSSCFCVVCCLVCILAVTSCTRSTTPAALQQLLSDRTKPYSTAAAHLLFVCVCYADANAPKHGLCNAAAPKHGQRNANAPLSVTPMRSNNCSETALNLAPLLRICCLDVCVFRRRRCIPAWVVQRRCTQAWAVQHQCTRA